MNLDENRRRLALYAVRDLIARRTLGHNSVPPGMYRFCLEVGPYDLCHDDVDVLRRAIKAYDEAVGRD